MTTALDTSTARLACDGSPTYCAQMVGGLRCTRFAGHRGDCADAYGNSMTNLDHMNDLFVVVQNIYGDELERIPVQPPHSLQAAMEMAADTRALLTNANVFIERPGNIDLGCPTGLTRDEREAVE